MAFETAYFALSFVFLAAASFTDLRQRIVPNWLNCAAIVVGLVLHFYESVDSGLTAVVATVGTFLAAYLLYRLGFWAGGDVKLFTAIAALNPINYAFIAGYLPIVPIVQLKLPVFPLTVFVFTLFAILPYALFTIFTKISQNKKAKDELSKDKLFIFALVATIGLFVAAFFWKAFPQPLLILPLALLLYVLFKIYLIGIKHVLVKEIPFSQLEEGMISSETIWLENGKVKRREALNLATVFAQLKAGNFGAIFQPFRPSPNTIVDQSAEGVIDEQIAQLKKLAKQKKLQPRLKVKESMALVPAVFIGYLLAQALGDFFWIFLI